MTALEVTPIEEETIEWEESHYVCCVDHDRTLCGVVIEGQEIEWGDPDDERTCIVCDDLGRGPSCPLFGTCVQPNAEPVPE